MLKKPNLLERGMYHNVGVTAKAITNAEMDAVDVAVGTYTPYLMALTATVGRLGEAMFTFGAGGPLTLDAGMAVGFGAFATGNTTDLSGVVYHVYGSIWVSTINDNLEVMPVVGRKASASVAVTYGVPENDLTSWNPVVPDTYNVSLDGTTRMYHCSFDKLLYLATNPSDSISNHAFAVGWWLRNYDGTATTFNGGTAHLFIERYDQENDVYMPSR